jgi:hypothetical protein
MEYLFTYQLAFRTPGSSPSKAMLRKQMRQSPNLRMNARARPHLRHLLYVRTLYFLRLLVFSIRAFLAITLPVD